MAIKGNVGLGIINILTTDTVLLNPDDGDRERAAVSAAYIHNDGGVTIIVEIYISPDLTSASGDRIDYYSIADNESVDISGIIAQGFGATDNIIAVADVVGCNAYRTIVEYTGGS